MKIQIVLENLNESNSNGIQIEKRNGIITSTWLIYKRKEKYYFFDINQKIEFIDRYCYTETELINELSNGNFNIEEFIS